MFEQPIQKTLEQKKIDDLGLDFDLSKFPEIAKRLSELGEHFDDSLNIAQIFKALWPKLNLENITLDEMARCAVLHDIGKSGPLKASKKVRTSVQTLFKSPQKPFNPYKEDKRQKTIADFINETGQGDLEKINEILSVELGIDISTESMLDFWRRHADWTFEILQAESEKPGQDMITPEIVTVTSSHHLLEDKNPANVDLENVPNSARVLEVLDKYELLTLVDKYQAFIDRSNLSHVEAIQVLRNIVAGNKKISVKGKEEYNKFIDILEKSEEKMKLINFKS